jgi:hypothetical protein
MPPLASAIVTCAAIIDPAVHDRLDAIGIFTQAGIYLLQLQLA